jgi:hypothetical protein
MKETSNAPMRRIYLYALKLKIVNIGIDEETRLTSMGEYLDDRTIVEITTLSHEYEYLFPNNFIEMTGILEEIKEKNIELKLDMKLLRCQSYH